MKTIDLRVLLDDDWDVRDLAEDMVIVYSARPRVLGVVELVNNGYGTSVPAQEVVVRPNVHWKGNEQP
jgi:hypothetical protein